MAKCTWCKQDMLDDKTVDCTANKTVEYPRKVDYPDRESLASVPYHESADPEHRCHDCNVTNGSKHHPGCDMERCPRCRGQLISCGCLDKEEDEDDWEEEDE